MADGPAPRGGQRTWSRPGADAPARRVCWRPPPVAGLVAFNRGVAAGSGLGSCEWVPHNALPELLGEPREDIGLNALYRCRSAVEPPNAAIENLLTQQGRDLFGFDNDILFYDLTSTYLEGRMADNPKAERGYSRDHRPDGKQLCIGLIDNCAGLPLG